MAGPLSIDIESGVDANTIEDMIAYPPSGDHVDQIGALARSDMASQVRGYVESFPHAVKLPTNHVELYIVRDFLSRKECDALIALIDANRVPSPVVSDDPIPSYRTSETCYLYPGPDAVAVVERKLDALTGLHPRYGEALQGQRYAVGQEFKPHHDFFDTGQAYWQDQAAMGGQRTWSAMTFLNEPGEGGRTNFPTAGVMIAPKAGNLVIWNNMDEYGVPNPGSLHQGMPVAQGVKYVLTKWYRERPWCQ